MSKQTKDWLMIQCEEKRARYINGEEIPNWRQGPPLWQVVHYLGRKGWLLFSDPASALWLGNGKLTFIRPQPLVIQCEDKHPRYINGKEILNWQQGPTVAEAVNYLGWKGWLLFSDPSALRLGYGKLTFIRPKQ